MNEHHQRRRIAREVNGTMFEGNYLGAGKIVVVSTAKELLELVDGG